MAKAEKGPRTVTCCVTGLPIEYTGRGRPPKFHPSIKAERERKARKDRYDAKRAAKAQSLRDVAAGSSAVAAI